MSKAALLAQASPAAIIAAAAAPPPPPNVDAKPPPRHPRQRYNPTLRRKAARVLGAVSKRGSGKRSAMGPYGVG